MGFIRVFLAAVVAADYKRFTNRRGLEGIGLAQRDLVSEHNIRAPMSLFVFAASRPNNSWDCPTPSVIAPEISGWTSDTVLMPYAIPIGEVAGS